MDELRRHEAEIAGRDKPTKPAELPTNPTTVKIGESFQLKPAFVIAGIATKNVKIEGIGTLSVNFKKLDMASINMGKPVEIQARLDSDVSTPSDLSLEIKSSKGNFRAISDEQEGASKTAEFKRWIDRNGGVERQINAFTEDIGSLDALEYQVVHIVDNQMVREAAA